MFFEQFFSISILHGTKPIASEGIQESKCFWGMLFQPCFLNFQWTIECRSISKCHLFSHGFSSSQLPNWWKNTLEITYVFNFTLPETIIASENGWLEDCFPFEKAYFQGQDMLVSGRVFHLESFRGQIPTCPTCSPPKKKLSKFSEKPQDLQISSHGNHSGTWISWQRNKGRWFRGAKNFLHQIW